MGAKCRNDAMAGVHPEDREYVWSQMDFYVAGENIAKSYTGFSEEGTAVIYGSKQYYPDQIRVIKRIYSVYQDMTKEREAQTGFASSIYDPLAALPYAVIPNALDHRPQQYTRIRYRKLSIAIQIDSFKTFGRQEYDFYRSGQSCG